MMIENTRRFWISAAWLTIAISAVLPARADDEMVASPRYTVWAKFKPESSVTLVADTKMGTNAAHVEVTRTLKSITPEEAKVETRSKFTFMGQTHESPPSMETINAKAAKREVKELGDKDVEAMGKTFKCKVYEVTGGSAQAMAPGAASGRAPAASDAKATLYISDDVPGGMVKLESTGRGGQVVTMVMTAMDVK